MGAEVVKQHCVKILFVLFSCPLRAWIQQWFSWHGLPANVKCKRVHDQFKLALLSFLLPPIMKLGMGRLGRQNQADFLVQKQTLLSTLFYLARSLGSSICSAIICYDSCPRYDNPGERVPLRVHRNIFQNDGLHARPLVFPLESFFDGTQHVVRACSFWTPKKPGLHLDAHRDFIFR